MMDGQLVKQVVETAAKFAAGGVVTPNGHGNISVRVPGAEEMYCTSAPSPNALGPEAIDATEPTAQKRRSAGGRHVRPRPSRPLASNGRGEETPPLVGLSWMERYLERHGEGTWTPHRSLSDDLR
jgi:hypothetical protein